MADYYTKPESEALFAAKDHTHDLGTMGGSELDSSRVLMPESVAADFDYAFSIDEGFVSVKNQLAGKAASNHTHSGYAPDTHSHSGYAATNHTHTSASIGAAPAEHSHDYADPDHTHTPTALGAAPAEHSHAQTDVTGLTAALTDKADVNHSHTPDSIGAASSEHTHTPASIGAAPSSHSHAQSDVTGLSSALEGKANTGHAHAQTDITGLPAALTAKADLVDGKVPVSQLPGYVSDVAEYGNLASFPANGESGKIYVAQDTNKTYRWSGSGYIEIGSSLALGETSATAYRGDRGKVAYDHSQNGNIHVTAAQKTTWDSKAAGNHTHTPSAIGAAPASHGHSYNDLTNKPTIPAAYTHPTSHPASMITGLAAVATTGNYSDLSGKPTIPTIPSSLPANGGNADTVDGKHAAAFALAGHVHATTPVTTANEDLDNYITAGIYSFAAAYQPVNRPEGTSNGWLVVIPWNASATVGTVKQFWLRHGTINSNDFNIYVRTKTGDSGWSTWATIYTSKNPPTAAEVGAIDKDLQFTNDDGSFKYSITKSSGKNLLDEIAGYGIGVYTIYSQTGVPGNPKTTEAWRLLVHKTGANNGWVLAFGSYDSVYVNYQDGATVGWRGWKCLVDGNPDALWIGSLYMNASHTVTPSKKLSECRTGWILQWSDYDASDSTTNDSDIVTTVIYKKGPSGANWSGQGNYFDIPRYIGSDSATDTSEEKRIIKRLYVHDNKLVGHACNILGDRTDVVLRAVYEF